MKKIMVSLGLLCGVLTNNIFAIEQASESACGAAHISVPAFIFMNSGLLDSLDGALTKQLDSGHVCNYGVVLYEDSLSTFVCGTLPDSLKMYSTPQDLIKYLKAVGTAPSLWSTGKKEVQLAIVRELVKRDGSVYSDCYGKKVVFALGSAHDGITVRFQ